MKIKWIRVENFRSIKDSGFLYLDSKLTLLAGKNESGKTNILKALESFDEDNFTEEDIPQDIDSEKEEDFNPSVTVCFEMNLSRVKKLGDKLIDENHFNEEHGNKTNFEFMITRSKNYIHDLDGELLEILFDEYTRSLENVSGNLVYLATLNNQLRNNSNPVAITDFDDKYVEDYIAEWKSILKVATDGLHAPGGNINLIQESINLLETLYKKHMEITDEIISQIPKFVFFDSFNDLLPDYIDSDEDTPKIVQNFYKLAKISDKNEIFSRTGQDRKRFADKISANITGEFGDYYSQNQIKLKVDLDGSSLYFYIYDQDELAPFRPEQRSKGFQWFLSFFLTLTAQGDKPLIILIDEPGLYLHAKAQEDILKLFEKLSINNQILVTTHSPYLLDPDKLERIRLVTRDVSNQNRTVIENKIHKGADKEALTPITTAIGLDLSKSLTFSPKFNVLLEGISDYYYIQAMKSYLKYDKEDVHFIPSVGASQIPNIASLLFGWQIEFKVVLDNDKEGSNTKDTLIKKLHLENEDILFVSPQSGNSIEDLFTTEDFNKFVLSNPSMSNEKNSKTVKAKGFDKVLLSKNFCELINSKNSVEVSLSAETMSNFNELFEKIFADHTSETSFEILTGKRN
ncbi:ATP-dependent nuclease [Priestia aryabhattai]